MTTYTPPGPGRLPERGDWFVVEPGEAMFDRIERAERLAEWLAHHRDPDWVKRTADPDWYKWGHAGVATRWLGQVLMIAEAEPGGAVERPWHWEGRPHMWSTATGLSVPAMGAAAQRYTQPGPWGQHGVGYSFIDYAAIGTHSLGILVPGLRQRIALTGRLICSQLVDQAAQDAGVHLFDDGRWPGYVTPLDLGMLLEAAGAVTLGG